MLSASLDSQVLCQLCVAAASVARRNLAVTLGDEARQRSCANSGATSPIKAGAGSTTNSLIHSPSSAHVLPPTSSLTLALTLSLTLVPSLFPPHFLTLLHFAGSIFLLGLCFFVWLCFDQFGFGRFGRAALFGFWGSLSLTTSD